MKNKKSLSVAGAVFAATISAGFLAANSTLAATPVSINTEEGLTACLATNGNICKLGADIAVANYIAIEAGTKSTLDLNGHALSTDKTKYDYDQSIESYGILTITDSGKNGTLDLKLYAEEGELNIDKGIFSQYIYGRNDSVINISDGTFRESIYSEGSIIIEKGTFSGSVHGSSVDILNGIFNDEVSISEAGKNTISGGKFNDTLFIGGENTEVTISGGEFTNINAINFYEGSSLTITDGKFTKGFSIALEKLSITGGTFYNGITESDGWMSLFIEHPDSQQYSIKGGTFLNTGDDNGTLLVLFTSERPTLDMVRALFDGGSVLNEKTMTIDLGDNDITGSYISHIKKKKVVVPDVDASTSKSTATTTSTNTNTSKSTKTTSNTGTKATEPTATTSNTDTKTSKPTKTTSNTNTNTSKPTATTSNTNTKTSKPAANAPDTGTFSKDNSGLIAATVSLGALAVLAGATYGARYVIERRKHRIDFEK